jgi:rhodanese-related sulfurtransferase
MSDQRMETQFMESKDLRDRLERGEALVILDVRTAHEFASGHIEGAINIPADQLTLRAGELPREATVVTVCSFGGARSCGAAEQLRALSHANVLPLKGGVRGWFDESKEA